MTSRMAILLLTFLRTTTLVRSQGRNARRRFQLRKRYSPVPARKTLHTESATQKSETQKRKPVSLNLPLSLRLFNMLFPVETLYRAVLVNKVARDARVRGMIFFLRAQPAARIPAEPACPIFERAISNRRSM